MGLDRRHPLRLQLFRFISSKTPQTSRQDAQGIRFDQAHEALRRAGRHRRQEGGVPRRMHQAAVGLPEEEQPPGPREQAVLHPRQEDGQDLRPRSHQGLRHGQVPHPPPVVNGGLAVIESSSLYPTPILYSHFDHTLSRHASWGSRDFYGSACFGNRTTIKTDETAAPHSACLPSHFSKKSKKYYSAGFLKNRRTPFT